MSNLLTRIASIATAILLLPAALFGQNYDKGPDLDDSKDYYAVIHTRLGKVFLRLYEDQAPMTVKNFVNLAEGTAEFQDPITKKTVKRPYYNGILFHRVIPNFMIQGGDPTGTGMGGPGYQFADEFVPELDFSRPGVLAMANSGPATNGSQFFITDATPTHLNQRHTIFGRVLENSGSLEVVKSIANEPRNSSDKPNKDVRMELIEIKRLEPGLSDADALAQLRGEAPATEAASEESAPEEAESSE